MNGFFKWFKSGAKIKRWIFLMLIGIVLVCYGIAKVLVTDEMGFMELAKIIFVFVLGFTFTIISIICIQRRTLEILVEESDTRDLEDKSKVKSLIFNRKIYNQGPKVVVIGGGDTGNDCVGTSIRLGCKSLIQLEMMPKLPDERQPNNPWPEWPLVKKTDYGQEENIAVFGEDPRVYNSTVKEFILDSKGNVKQAVIVKLQTVVKDGRRSFEQVPGSEKTVPCDLVLIAAGFIGAQKPVINAFGVELDARNTVKCDENDHHTNISKLYSAGDVRRGQSLVVWAIREGREVAKQVDFDLMGYTGL